MTNDVEKFIQENGVTKCPPALAKGGEQSTETKRHVKQERSKWRNGGEISRWRGIKKVALEIAYDNGMINRSQTEADWLRSLDAIITSSPEEKLKSLNDFCLSLDKDQIETLAAGEQAEMETLQNQHDDPEFCNALFERIFNGE